MLISALFAILAGLLAGISINYLADVLPPRRRLTRPFCLHCQMTVSWIDYILLRPCKECKRGISSRHHIVLLLSTVLAALLWFFTPQIGYWPSFLIAGYFGLVIVIDLEHRLVMHPVSLAGTVLGLGMGTWLHGFTSSLIGGVAGFVIMLALYFLGIGFVRWLSKKRTLPEDGEGIGFGDVILSGVMGTFLGWPGVVAGLVLTIVLGGLASFGVLIVLLLRKQYKVFSAIPYAPFIAVATVILLLLARR